MIVRQLMGSVGAALALASALLAATAGPSSGPRALDLRLVKDRAICPIEVMLDHNPTRSPPTIKVLKCARQPLARCLAGNVSRAHCCEWRDGDLVGECVEILDYVAVRYRWDGAGAALSPVEPYAVPVGCTCMAAPSTRALLAD